MNLHSFFRFKTSSLSNFKPFLIWSTPRHLNGICSSKNPFPFEKIANNMRRSARKRPTVEAKACKTTGNSDSIKPDGAAGKKRTKKNKKATDNDQAGQANDETSPFQNTNDPSVAPPEPEPGERLGRNFYDQDAVTLAKALLGKVLCRKLPETGQVLKGTVVETEAYPGKGDAASRSFKGVPTPSSMAMFMDPGTAYVYFTYGMYYCFNVSAKEYGGACLLRAIEVHEDYEIMHTLRQSKTQQTNDKPPKRLKQHELANGPAKLCLAFGITRDTCDKVDMASSDELWLEDSLDPTYHHRQFEMEVSRRVGIDSTPPEARDLPYRFYIADNKSVSPAKFKEITNKKAKRGGTK